MDRAKGGGGAAESQAFAGLAASLQDRLAACQEILRQMGSVVVAFSAGVDSTFLLALARLTLGSEKVLAVMGVSPSLGRRERDAGRELAHRIGAPLEEIETGEMADQNYAANPANRCFYCKHDLFSRLIRLADERGFSYVASGANADDTGDFRPGMQAGAKLGIRNPLLEAGLTKEDIRRASRALELPTWNKPAMACLASRIPYGQEITAAGLARVEQAENFLKDLGFAECRVRDHQTMARIEVPAADLAGVAAQREGIVTRFKALGYTYVALDLEGFRSGSMNEPLQLGPRGAS